MTKSVASYVIPHQTSCSHSDFIAYVDESGDHSLTSIDRTTRYSCCRSTEVLEGKFYRDKTGNKLGMGLKCFRENRKPYPESRRAPVVPGARRRPRSRNPFARNFS